MFHKSRRSTIALLLLAWPTVGLVGCSVDFAPTNSPGDTLDPAGADTERPEDTVTVRFRNFSVSDAVDVEFYVSDQPGIDLPDGLFVVENRMTANVGFAGTGLVPPRQLDAVEIPCSDDLVIGTTGGTFVDAETGEPRGQGLRRWAQAGPLGFCGSVVTLDFDAVDDQFTTTVHIGE